MDGITIVEPSFNSSVLPNAPLEKLAEGLRWLEGPVWFADMQCLLVSDLLNNRIMRWTESGGMSVFRDPSGFANGHTRDREGRLIGCSHGDSCVKRTELDGTVWFTDPACAITTDYEGGKRDPELPANVYRFDPRDGSLAVVADDFDGPNGLCFSRDERLLYVSESGAPFANHPLQQLRVFDVSSDGASLLHGRDFYKVSPGFTDGFRCDDEGNLWSSAGDGVHCIWPQAELLGKIAVPFVVSNLCFGGRHRSRLFLCGSHTLFAMYVNKRGAQRP